jgi:hypothetical protein
MTPDEQRREALQAMLQTEGLSAEHLRERVEALGREVLLAWDDFAQLDAYVDRAKRVADRLGRVQGEPLDHFLESLGQRAAYLEEIAAPEAHLR